MMPSDTVPGNCTEGLVWPTPHSGSGVERIGLICFLAGCHERWLNHSVSVLSLIPGFFRECFSVPRLHIDCIYCLLCWVLIELRGQLANTGSAGKMAVKMECVYYIYAAPAFPSVFWHCWLGDRKGIRPVKKLDVGLLVVIIWLELCTTYRSSCHHHLRHPLLQ